MSTQIVLEITLASSETRERASDLAVARALFSALPLSSCRLGGSPRSAHCCAG
ncbi:hypothetical protein DB32_002228 [Sandaracinus amylolyticus]|uniref:Uncharacterized protein n=1 Tax=Sandaracinus amylolyticus TaxID=927083 RepID=A0A0F6SEF0_9BACT|nr:hypothetical protein DB32_002228 [Sandaracinus amylolyticus]